jgi:predicted acyltransferase
MSEAEQATGTTLRQQKVLDLLQEGVRTWDQLRALTKINDDNLGFTIGELLNMRKIWTMQRSEVRVYGIERRIGLVSRFAHEQRRASDSHS